MQRKSVVISLGGSVFIQADRIDTTYIIAFASLLKKLSKKYKIFVVTGGGSVARLYIENMRKIMRKTMRKPVRTTRMFERVLDDIGIAVTRLNAKVLIAALGKIACPIVPADFETAINAAKTHKVVVMGGTTTGHTTDAVAAMLAERANACRIINITSVDGVYSADPKKCKTAKRFETLTPAQLLEIVKPHTAAGTHGIFDLLAVKVLMRAKIPLYVLAGIDLTNLENAIDGKEFYGTKVVG